MVKPTQTICRLLLSSYLSVFDHFLGAGALRVNVTTITQVSLNYVEMVFTVIIIGMEAVGEKVISESLLILRPQWIKNLPVER